MPEMRLRPGLGDRHLAHSLARAADRDVVAGGLDLRLEARKVERGLVEEGVERTAAGGKRGLKVVLAVVVVAVWEAAVVVVDWGGCLSHSKLAAARNMGTVAVGFVVVVVAAAAVVVVHTNHWHTLV